MKVTKAQLKRVIKEEIEATLSEKQNSVDMNAAQQMAAALSTDRELMRAVKQAVAEQPEVQTALQGELQELVKTDTAKVVGGAGTAIAGAGFGHMAIGGLGAAGAALAVSPALAGFAVGAGSALMLTALGILAHNMLKNQALGDPREQW